LIDVKRMVGTFLDLVRINSPSFFEAEIGGYLRARLEGVGFSVRFQDYGNSFNLIATKKGTRSDAPSLMVSAHMDTVEPTEGIVVHADDTVVRSAGPTVLGADDKAALSQIMEAVTVLNERGVSHGDIEIVLSSAEEKGLVGAKHLDFESLRSRHCLVLDSSGPVGVVVIGAPTHITYEMTVTGRPAHAGIEPENGISAIRTAARIVSEVPDGRIDAETTANVGIISGGTATNVVPRETLIRGEVRSHNADMLSQTRDAIFSTARRICRETGADIAITEQEEYRSFRIPANDPFLGLVEAAMRNCGIDPVTALSGGGSDANIFNRRGITAVNLSVGMQKVHSTDEFIYVEDLRRGASVVLRTITDFAGFNG
jgi:tripeptide aminopeptidase